MNGKATLVLTEDGQWALIVHGDLEPHQRRVFGPGSAWDMDLVINEQCLEVVPPSRAIRFIGFRCRVVGVEALRVYLDCYDEFRAMAFRDADDTVVPL
jgi:hypothetical protein